MVAVALWMATERHCCCKDGNGSDTHGIRSGYYFLLYFNSNTDTNSDIFEYEYKTDTLDSDSNSDIYSIYEMIFCYFLYR